MDYFFFFCKIRKPYFVGVFERFPQNEIFLQKSGTGSFLPLQQPNFMRSFKKIIRAVLEKTCLPTDILKY